MPMILLAIRVEMEVILKVNFPQFMENITNEEKAMRLVNGVITELLDPKIYYSRFSFLESGKEAIDRKHVINTKKTSSTIEKGSSKYYTRSALVKNVIPRPSDGQVRAIFKDDNALSKLASAGQRSLQASHLEASKYQSVQRSPNQGNYSQM